MRRDERGMSLPEVLISMVIFTFVMGAVLSLLEATAKQAPKDQERAMAIREAQAGLHRMTRELRQAYKVLDADPKSMYVLIARSTPPDKHVRYDCDVVDPLNSAYRQCVRREALVGQTLPATGSVVVERSLSQVLFTYSPGPLNPNFVKIHIEVPQKGERKAGLNRNLVLDDGFYLRNTDVVN
jgi:prepilin-type N-terminal cleavage/methylation domain-containing protein